MSFQSVVIIDKTTSHGFYWCMAERSKTPQPLTDRTLVHGRNVMASAGVILVLAWAPGIKIRDFHPMDFQFTDGSELSVWLLLVGVMIYYAGRFAKDCHTDFPPWKNEFIKKGFSDVASREQAEYLDKRAWRWDMLPPFAMAVFAVIAAGQKIIALL